MPRLLPLFPLRLVAFPGEAIPLHIFEPRYRQMVGEAEASGSEFGIVLAHHGGVVRVGCTVLVESVPQRYEDGTFDVVTRGQRRFEIQSIDEEKEYLRAEVEYFADEDATPAEPQLRADAVRAWALLREQTGGGGSETPPEPDDLLLSFRIAAAIGDLEVQSGLLPVRSETERLRQIVSLVPRFLERKHYAAKMQKVAASNGKGHKPGGTG